ncbi:MAG: hypothetical protein NTX50_27760, partial [Candidatus Sumerlaeota bacterium]|nr:hypothetical protein [Candidatus Sumerlaeota bacterium]
MSASRNWSVLFSAAVLLFFLASARAEISITDGTGAIRGLMLHGETMEVKASLRLPVKGWGKIPTQSAAKDIKTSRQGNRFDWTGRVEIESGKSCQYEETLDETSGGVHVSYRVFARDDLNLEGVFFWVDIPLSDFAGGRYEVLQENGQTTNGIFPSAQPASRHLLYAKTASIVFSDAAAARKLEVTLDRPCSVVIQDNREFKGNNYSAFFTFYPGALAKGQIAALDATLKLTGKAESAPARLTLDATKSRYRMDGFGGNYCFNIESPVSQFTLDTLRQGWARTEMRLDLWAPDAGNFNPGVKDWAALEAADEPDSRTRLEFEIAKKIQSKGIRYCISIWRLPNWLYEDGGANPNDQRHKIHPDKWPHLLECIGSYLLYAKRKYGVEPELFSFNEPDYGVRVLFSPEEHRDAIKRIGAHFAKLGLKTKMALADVTNPRDTVKYALPAAADPEALKYIGAVSFHSWGGAKPEQYQAWGDLAARLKLPLLVAELGVDAGAWRGGAYNTFHYGVQEAAMYQELVLYARPQGTMQWEFTADYSTVKVDDAGRGKPPRLTPTSRYCFVKHFCNLTPLGAEALTTSGDNPKVLFTAFRGQEGGKPVLALHILNTAGARTMTLSGLPKTIQTLRAVRTSETDSFKDLPPVAVKDGAIQMELPEQSLLTLTAP